MSQDYEPGEGYLTDEEIAARRPWYMKLRDGCLTGCSIDLAILFGMFALPTWWILN